MQPCPTARPFSFPVRGTAALRAAARWAQALAAALMLAALAPAWAQPANGSQHRDSLALGGGSSVPLPEGSWRVTHSGSFRLTPQFTWDNVVLKNEQPTGNVRFLVVSQSQESGRWGNTGCQSDSPSHFMVDEHGSKPNQLVNKCSRVFAHNNLGEWARFENWNVPQNIKDWWASMSPGLADLQATSARGLLQVELRVQQFNGRMLQLQAFALPPQGMTPVRFREDFRAGQRRPEHELLSRWNAIYIESLQQSYFNKKPQALLALAYPVDDPATGGRAQAVAQASAPGTPAMPPAAPGGAGATASAAVVAASTAPQATPRPAAGLELERQRLEAERRAAEEERRNLAQQLEAMSKMLAKLQQENQAQAAAQARESSRPAAEEARPRPMPILAHRKALVIGNDLYTEVPRLNNAGADADAMARSLEAVGYKVSKHLNLDEKGFKRAIRDFKQLVNGGDEVLVFFAGHGVQLGNANYLLPVDIKGDNEEQVKDEAIMLQRILDDLEDKKTKFALAVIDACRDNPFKGKGRALGGRGLAPTTAATGQMIMFSAGSGQQALDRLSEKDPEKNGLFTRIFVKEMQKPGISVDRVLRNVRNEVVRLAKSVGHDQTPALYDQSIGEFFFRQ